MVQPLIGVVLMIRFLLEYPMRHGWRTAEPHLRPIVTDESVVKFYPEVQWNVSYFRDGKAPAVRRERDAFALQ